MSIIISREISTYFIWKQQNLKIPKIVYHLIDEGCILMNKYLFYSSCRRLMFHKLTLFGGNEMLRKGRFAVVDGKEYKLFSCYRQYYLRTNNVLECANGFSPSSGKKDEWIKKVRLQTLEDAYEVFPYVMLEGYRFSVEGADEQTGMVALVTCNPFTQKKIAVKPYGIDEYMIKLPID